VEQSRIVKMTAQLSAAKIKNWRICTPTVVCLQACTGTNLLLPLGEVVHNIGIQAEGIGASFGS
jgi:preprotein translocase subunit SecY